MSSFESQFRSSKLQFTKKLWQSSYYPASSCFELFLRGDDEGCCSYRDLCYSYSDLMLFLHLFLCEEEIGNGSSSLSPWKLRASQEQLRRVELAFLLMPCVVILLEIESSRYTIRKVQTQYIHLEEGTQRSSKKGRLAARGREAAGGSQ